MKILLINGGPHEKGSTNVAIEEIAKTLNENNIKRVTLYMKRMICDFMYRYIDMDKEELARQRYNRFRKM